MVKDLLQSIMFKGEDMHELRIELLAFKLGMEECEQRKRHLSRKSDDPVDKIGIAIDALIPNKTHVFRRIGSGIKKRA